jgi:hypothetical protein
MTQWNREIAIMLALFAVILLVLAFVQDLLLNDQFPSYNIWQSVAFAAMITSVYAFYVWVRSINRNK